MSQLPLFGEVSQIQPIATALRASAQRQAIARSTPQPKPRSKHTRSTPQPQAVTQPSIAPIARSPQHPPAPQPEALPATPAPVAAIAPANRPGFDPLKHCRLCGADIKIGGLDHSLCSGDCGWVVDLQWLAWMEAHRRKRKEPEPQAATHTTESNESETLDLFTYGLEGGEA